jgi:Tubulin binding cofactor A
MAPTQVQISTSVLQRLIKEEASYYKELDQQKVRIAKIERGEVEDVENQEYQLKQEVSEEERLNAAPPCDEISDGVDLWAAKRTRRDQGCHTWREREDHERPRKAGERIGRQFQSPGSFLMLIGAQDQAANEDERSKAMDVLKQAKEAQKDGPVG